MYGYSSMFKIAESETSPNAYQLMDGLIICVSMKLNIIWQSKAMVY